MEPGARPSAEHGAEPVEFEPELAGSRVGQLDTGPLAVSAEQQQSKPRDNARRSGTAASPRPATAAATTTAAAARWRLQPGQLQNNQGPRRRKDHPVHQPQTVHVHGLGDDRLGFSGELLQLRAGTDLSTDAPGAGHPHRESDHRPEADSARIRQVLQFASNGVVGAGQRHQPLHASVEVHDARADWREAGRKLGAASIRGILRRGSRRGIANGERTVCGKRSFKELIGLVTCAAAAENGLGGRLWCCVNMYRCLYVFVI